MSKCACGEDLVQSGAALRCWSCGSKYRWTRHYAPSARTVILRMIGKCDSPDVLVSNVTRFLATMPVGRDTRNRVHRAVEARMRFLRMRALASGVR